MRTRRLVLASFAAFLVVLVASAAAEVYKGTKGDDEIVGSDSEDMAWGYAGDDVIYGYADDDKLYGGAGADIIQGGSNTDRIYGSSGADKLYGQSEDDIIYAYPKGKRDRAHDYVDCGASSWPWSEDVAYVGPGDKTHSCEIVHRRDW